ncbi:MAG TPA: sensor histidine kinase [Candidatus Binataceae bacterium]|jgi:signal transduction histidine kinase|nr:sensor histidine kinase [Candidatus Binataceae bacterium]
MNEPVSTARAAAVSPRRSAANGTADQRAPADAELAPGPLPPNAEIGARPLPLDAEIGSQPLPLNAEIGARLKALADLGTHLADGASCLIAWQTPGDANTLRAAADSRSESLLNSMLAAVERHPRYLSPSLTSPPLRLGHRELAAAGSPHPSAMTAAAVTVSRSSTATVTVSPSSTATVTVSPTSSATDGAAALAVAEPNPRAMTAAVNGKNRESTALRATVILIAPHTPYSLNLESAAEITATAALAVLTASAADASRALWRQRTGESAQRLLGARTEAAGASAERDCIDRAADAAARLPARNRFARLGAIFARLGPFDAWILAIGEGEILRVVAAADATAPATLTEASAAHDQPASEGNALDECFSQQATIVRTLRPAKRIIYCEDRTFARFGSYICVPFENGAIALAGQMALDAITVARLETLAARVNPLIAQWLLQAETDRLQRLVRQLGLRMFGAIDSERARIARDLHDHQAQLLAAARIGIEAGTDEARAIFKQLENELRLRVRELRPPTLGRSTLADGLRFELRRLADAGIKGRLNYAEKTLALTRHVQQVCYQVAREALANVLRHAGASRVEITIEKRREIVLLSILDNGRGIGRAAGRNGLGLHGLNERLELMGGRLRVESKPGATRLTAEIPRPA